MKKDRQLVILLAALLVLIFFYPAVLRAKTRPCPLRPLILPTPRTIPKAKKAAAEAAAKEQEP